MELLILYPEGTAGCSPRVCKAIVLACRSKAISAVPLARFHFCRGRREALTWTTALPNPTTQPATNRSCVSPPPPTTTTLSQLGTVSCTARPLNLSSIPPPPSRTALPALFLLGNLPHRPTFFDPTLGIAVEMREILIPWWLQSAPSPIHGKRAHTRVKDVPTTERYTTYKMVLSASSLPKTRSSLSHRTFPVAIKLLISALQPQAKNRPLSLSLSQAHSPSPKFLCVRRGLLNTCFVCLCLRVSASPSQMALVRRRQRFPLCMD